MIKDVKEMNVEGKRVLVRVDFNVSLSERGEITDDLRIRESLPTIEHLVKKRAKVVLLSHFNEPEEKRTLEEKKESGKMEKENSLAVVAEKLSSMLGKKVELFPDCVGEKAKRRVEEMKEGEVLLLENLRMYKEEKEGSMNFAKELSRLGDVYVNDAFSVSHRNHASVSKLPEILPGGAGVLMQKEIKILEKIKKDPQKPVVAIIGGAKVKSKISTVRYFIEHADHVLLGGKIANTLLIVRELAHNAPFPEKEIVDAVKDMDYTVPRLHLPVDVIASTCSSGKKKTRETAVGSVEKKEDIFDIGKETIKLYGDVIKEARTIIWAGPLGLSEKKPFEKGTKEVGEYIARNKGALKVAGGGDTNKALKQFGLRSKMDHISCGGGAMLTYLTGGFMPGIKALEK